MYYKKQGDAPPLIMSGSVYEESYTVDGCLYLKYSQNNAPSETLTEITQEEYEANKPVIPKPEPTPPEPTPQDIINANNTTMLLKISKALGV